MLAALVTLASWLVFPDLFLSLPRDRPMFCAIIMLIYPLLSVWPQEMLYRSLLFSRYAPILRTNGVRIAASAITFGLAHVIFPNWIAIVMTAAGGLLFAWDYARHRSLWVTGVEHSLYGRLIFTVGLGAVLLYRRRLASMMRWGLKHSSLKFRRLLGADCSRPRFRAKPAITVSIW